MGIQWVATEFGGPEVLQPHRLDPRPPRHGQVNVDVRAAGLNPSDYKHIAPGQARSLLPLTIGSEVAGVISAIGPDTTIATGGGVVGDEVVAFRVRGGYASALTVDATDVFAKPSPLDFAQAANLLLVGTTASEMLHVAQVQAGDLVLLHGAAGAVGTSVLQQARLRGAQVIGTAAPANFAAVRRYDAIPVQYGPGLEQRVRDAAPGGVAAALDTVGTDEAIDVSLRLVADRRRIVTIAALARAQRDHIQMLGATNPTSGPYRAAHRAAVLELAAQGRLEVPIAATYPFSEAPAALAALMGPHGHGKLALLI